jgi:molybdopterin biosynthesis enzyme
LDGNEKGATLELDFVASAPENSDDMVPDQSVEPVRESELSIEESPEKNENLTQSGKKRRKQKFQT